MLPRRRTHHDHAHPAMIALAGLVPWAETDQDDVAVGVAAASVPGANDSRPVSSPWAPVGLRTRREPCDLAEGRLQLVHHLRVAAAGHAEGVQAATRHVTQHLGGAFSFIVHEPSGIIEVSRPMSLRSNAPGTASSAFPTGAH